MGTSGQLDEAKLRRLIEVGTKVVAELDLERLFREVLAAARDLTGAHYAALGILDEHRRELERFVTSGIAEEQHAAIGDLPRGRGVLGVLISDPKPLRLRNVGNHPHSYGFPPGHPPMTTFLGVPVRIRGEAWGNLYLTDKEGGEEFTAADEQATLVLADWTGIAVENARLYQSADARRRDLERAVIRLEATSEIARALGGETDLDRVLELIAKRGRALVGARAIVILLEREGALHVAATAGELDRSATQSRVPVEGTPFGSVLLRATSSRLDAHSQQLREAATALGSDASSGLLVPLLFRGSASGVLAAFGRMAAEAEFGPEDEQLLGLFASSAATAVHTAQSVAQGRLKQSIESAEQERRRWARELHDETLQGLAGVKVLLSSAAGDPHPLRLEQAVNEAVTHIESEIQSLRALITELRPAALDELGLGPALEALTERTASIEGIHVDVDADLAVQAGQGSARLDPELESTIYRVVQEALTNAAKHARANQVTVRVRESDDSLLVTVRDDGAGFDTSRGANGFGLEGMRERVDLAGGTLEIASTPGEGTTISADFPIRRA